MTQNTIERKLNKICNILYKNDIDLINEKAHERTIVSRMIPYFKIQFNNYLIDSDYNREGEIGNRQVKKDIDNNPILPDLIVHRYGPKGINLLAIEAKGYWNKYPREKDEMKLIGLKKKQGYKFIYRIELNKDKAEIIEVLSN